MTNFNRVREKMMSFEQKIKELQEFIVDNDGVLPNKNDKSALFSDGKSICKWIQEQRTNFKNNKLPEEKIDKLNDVGFIWNERKNEEDDDNNDTPSMKM